MSDDNKRSQARDLRKNMTDAEQKLWSHLRGKRLKNIKFRRQEPLGDYIVDFVSFEIDLIIEVDGSQHLVQEEYDKERTEWLENEGFTVIRFWNDDVLQETERVLEKITSKIEELT